MQRRLAQRDNNNNNNNNNSDDKKTNNKPRGVTKMNSATSFLETRRRSSSNLNLNHSFEIQHQQLSPRNADDFQNKHSDKHYSPSKSKNGTNNSNGSQSSKSNNNSNSDSSNYASDGWNIIALVVICSLFLILQSYGFRNLAIRATGRWSPYNTVNPHPSFCPQATCNNTPHCKPCQRRFLIIIATGRSGSTTLMNLLDKLPNVRMAGENKGQLINDYATYRTLHDSIELELESTKGVEGAWKHFPISKQAISCPIQNLYEAINPPPELTVNFRGSYDDSQTIIGFKTVRLHQALEDMVTDKSNYYHNETMLFSSPQSQKQNHHHNDEFTNWSEFLIETFPCAKFVFNVRGDIDKQVQSWLAAFGTHLDGDVIRTYNHQLSTLAAKLGSDQARVIDMSEWSKKDGSGLNVLNDLVEWLGFRQCTFSSLIHSNHDGYGKDQTKLSLGDRCHLYAQ